MPEQLDPIHDRHLPPTRRRSEATSAEGLPFLREILARSEGNDDLSLRVALAEVAQRVGELVEVVAPVDHGRHLSRLEELPEDVHVRSGDLGDEEGRFLAAAGGTPEPRGGGAARPEQARSGLSAHEDDPRLWPHDAP